MCVGYFYTRSFFEFNSYHAIVSTLSWSALWPVFAGVLVMLATAKLRAKIPTPPAGDLLVIYREVARLLDKSIRITVALSNIIARYLSILGDHSKVWALSMPTRLSKQLSIETPGMVMVVILAALLYSFLT
jgi:hypothetical protein